MRRLLVAGLPRWRKDPAWQPCIAFVERILAVIPAQRSVGGSEDNRQAIGLTNLRPALCHCHVRAREHTSESACHATSCTCNELYLRLDKINWV